MIFFNTLNSEYFVKCIKNVLKVYMDFLFWYYILLVIFICFMLFWIG